MFLHAPQRGDDPDRRSLFVKTSLFSLISPMWKCKQPPFSTAEKGGFWFGSWSFVWEFPCCRCWIFIKACTSGHHSCWCVSFSLMSYLLLEYCAYFLRQCVCRVCIMDIMCERVTAVMHWLSLTNKLTVSWSRDLSKVCLTLKHSGSHAFSGVGGVTAGDWDGGCDCEPKVDQTMASTCHMAPVWPVRLILGYWNKEPSLKL